MRVLIAAAGLLALSQGAPAQEQPVLTNEEFRGVASNLLNPEVDWARMRRNAEKAVRDRLVDPSSGDFEWPNGFFQGYWKPILQKRVTGYVTCGTVNAKNRMGGYVGRAAFVVVMQDADTALFVDMDSGTDRYGLVEAQCRKAANLLPAAPPEFSDEPAPGAVVSVADELAKLAKLKADGVLTQEEFDAQKAKLLGR